MIRLYRVILETTIMGYIGTTIRIHSFIRNKRKFI